MKKYHWMLPIYTRLKQRKHIICFWTRARAMQLRVFFTIHLARARLLYPRSQTAMLYLYARVKLVPKERKTRVYNRTRAKQRKMPRRISSRKKGGPRARESEYGLTCNMRAWRRKKRANAFIYTYICVLKPRWSACVSIHTATAARARRHLNARARCIDWPRGKKRHWIFGLQPSSQARVTYRRRVRASAYVTP